MGMLLKIGTILVAAVEVIRVVSKVMREIQAGKRVMSEQRAISQGKGNSSC